MALKTHKTAAVHEELSIFLGFIFIASVWWSLSGRRRRRVPSPLVHPGFVIDPALLKGKVELGTLSLCRVFLVDDSQYAGWLVLVPQQDNLVEIIDLAAEHQKVLWIEVAAALQVIRRIFHPNKLNQAAIGNVVAQLHIHVAGRMREDAAWPGVHLGAKPAVPYSSAELKKLMTGVRDAFKEEQSVHFIPLKNQQAKSSR